MIIMDRIRPMGQLEPCNALSLRHLLHSGSTLLND